MMLILVKDVVSVSVDSRGRVSKATGNVSSVWKDNSTSRGQLLSLTSILLLLLVFHHPLTLLFQAKNLPFLQILPTTAFPFLLQD